MKNDKEITKVCCHLTTRIYILLSNRTRRKHFFVLIGSQINGFVSSMFISMLSCTNYK